MDNKFDKYGKLLHERNNFFKEQATLHKKYRNIDEDKIIIETSNSYKFTLQLIKTFIKTISGILLVLLASIGIISLIYPDVRSELFKVVMEIIKQGKNMI